MYTNYFAALHYLSNFLCEPLHHYFQPTFFTNLLVIFPRKIGRDIECIL